MEVFELCNGSPHCITTLYVLTWDLIVNLACVKLHSIFLQLSKMVNPITFVWYKGHDETIHTSTVHIDKSTHTGTTLPRIHKVNLFCSQNIPCSPVEWSVELLSIIEEFSIVYQILPCDEIPRRWETKYWIVVGVVGELKVEPNGDAECLKIAFDFTFCVETSPPI